MRICKPSPRIVLRSARPDLLLICHKSRYAPIWTGTESPVPIRVPLQQDPLSNFLSRVPITLDRVQCDHGDIRVSPDGQPSVFDMIRVLGGQKNPRQVWERLIASHPEVVPKCDNLQFPGPGQRDTPVAKTKEDAYYILGLLPGAVGKQYREEAAKLFVTFLDAPEKAVYLAVDRLSQDGLKRVEAWFRCPLTRSRFSDPLPVDLHPPHPVNNQLTLANPISAGGGGIVPVSTAPFFVDMFPMVILQEPAI